MCPDDSVIVINGLDLTDIVEEKELELTQVFRCLGPKTFPIGDSTKRLFTFEVFPVNKLKEWEQIRIKAYDASVQTPAKK